MSKQVTVTVVMTVPDRIADRDDLLDIMSKAASNALRPLLIEHYENQTQLTVATVEIADQR